MPRLGYSLPRRTMRTTWCGWWTTCLHQSHAASSVPHSQFPLEEYNDDLVWMAGRTAEEVVGILRRGSVGFAR